MILSIIISFLFQVIQTITRQYSATTDFRSKNNVINPLYNKFIDEFWIKYSRWQEACRTICIWNEGCSRQGILKCGIPSSQLNQWYTLNHPGNPLALKLIDMKNIKGEVHKTLLSNEMEILRLLTNIENIIKLY